jgi:hypothetical protein
VIPSNVFSLCFAPNGGYFSVGGINKTLHQEDNVKYISYYDSSFYKVKLKDVIINSQDFLINQNDYFTIIDSGTTLSYFPRKLYNDVEKQINVVCSEINRCMGDSYTAEIGICFKLKENITVLQFIESMPTLTFVFENDVKYLWKPENYLFNYTDPASNDKRLTFCIGLTGWNSNEILLGSTWMHNHDIIFDLQNKKIGLVESNCAAENVLKLFPLAPAPSATLTPTGSCDAKVDLYIKMIILITSLASIVIIILAYALHRLRLGQSFLWMRLSSEEIMASDRVLSKHQINLDKVIQEIEPSI